MGILSKYKLIRKIDIYSRQRIKQEVPWPWEEREERKFDQIVDDTMELYDTLYKMPLSSLFAAMKQDYFNWSSAAHGSRTPSTFAQKQLDNFYESICVSHGSKYIKISRNYSNGQEVVWGFIVNTGKDKKFARGDILKAASFNAPTRNFARGNVLTGDLQGVSWCAPR